MKNFYHNHLSTLSQEMILFYHDMSENFRNKVGLMLSFGFVQYVIYRMGGSELRSSPVPSARVDRGKQNGETSLQSQER
ncbi:hypothetical protein E3Q24_03397 [Wallemia mellicola]|uniref:Uncharacterized protein n=1 Tax=Wallemia mellicola TaxID=1708541 RepID=A0AB74KDL3_9BASI|nr:hypothetical protein E3Q24_03397 [Wallemia mellicola]TIC21488.1 hypothetical protein E3Q12_03411 [Wallemia mellicola]TIC60298.1 hypothetical protein E3Q03_03327 [Wallemia mellicola]